MGVLCVCICVCERERERESAFFFKNGRVMFCMRFTVRCVCERVCEHVRGVCVRACDCVRVYVTHRDTS